MDRYVNIGPQHWPSDRSSSSWTSPERNQDHWDLVYHRISLQPCSRDPCKIKHHKLSVLKACTNYHRW